VLGVPEPAIVAIEKERKTNASATLTAPIDGVVTELAVREGTAFASGTVLFRINGLQTVWVNAQIPEAQVSMITPGSAVTAQRDSVAGHAVQRALSLHCCRKWMRKRARSRCES
jgi:Cu(I)/Ag(I) efflux system membrane fusion protein